MNNLFLNYLESLKILVLCMFGAGLEKSRKVLSDGSLFFSKDWHFKDLITWKKQRGIGMRKGWLYTREEIMWFVKDNKQFIWNKEWQYSEEKPTYRPSYAIKNNLYKSEFKRISNVWADIMEDGMGTCSTISTQMSLIKKEGNIARKPIKALERIIKSCTNENDLVLDCFGGSRSTAIVCKNVNRNYILIEQDEKYCDLIRTRLQNPITKEITTTKNQL